MQKSYTEMINDPSGLLNALENITPSDRELKRQLFDVLLPDIRKALTKNGDRKKKKIHAALVAEGLEVSFNTFSAWLKEADDLQQPKLSAEGDGQERKRSLELAS